MCILAKNTQEYTNNTPRIQNNTKRIQCILLYSFVFLRVFFCILLYSWQAGSGLSLSILSLSLPHLSFHGLVSFCSLILLSFFSSGPPGLCDCGPLGLWASEPLALGNWPAFGPLGLLGPRCLWTFGAFWTSGPLGLLGLWASGPLRLWASGPLMSLGLWASVPLGLWVSGPLAL